MAGDVRPRPGSDGAPGNVRRARRAEVGRLAELASALSEHHAALDPVFAARPETRRIVFETQLERELHDPDRGVWVWEENGRALGLCVARIDRSMVALEAMRMEITDLVVEEAARGRGAGSALLEAALGWARARGVRRAEVRVATANAGAQRFWRRHGFGDLVDVLHRRL